MTEQPSYACPACGEAVPAGPAACPHCGVSFVGEAADRLRAIHAEIAALTDERVVLVARLRAEAQGSRQARPPSTAPTTVPTTASTPVQRPGEGAAAGAAGGAVEGTAEGSTTDVIGTSWIPRFPAAGARPSSDPLAGAVAPPPRAPRPAFQVVLYTLAGLLLLAGTSVFVVAVWLLVGVVGQAIIMLALTCSALGTAVSLAPRLPGASETLAVVGVGLLLIDADAAWRLDLLGLREVPGPRYAAAASALVVIVLLLVHRGARGQVAALLPATLVVGAVGAGSLAAAVRTSTVGGLGAVVVLLGSAVLSGVLLLLLRGLARTAPERTRERVCLVLATAVAAASALVLGISGLTLDLRLGYDVTGTARSTRYGAGLLLLLVLLALVRWEVATSVRSRARAIGSGAPTHLRWTPALLVPGCLLALGPALLDVPRAGWVGVTLVLAVAAGGVRIILGRLRELGPYAVVGGLLVQLLTPASALTVLVLSRQGVPDLGHLDRPGTLGTLPLAVELVGVVAVLVVAVLGTVLDRGRSGEPWAAAVGPTWLALALVAVRPFDAAWVVLVPATLAALPASTLAARASSRTLQRSTWLTLEISLALPLLVAGGLGIGSAIIDLHDDAWATLAVLLVLLGLGVLGYASAPGRLPLAYLGSVLLSASTWVVSAHLGAAVIEVYTLPLAALLLGVAAAQVRRSRAAGHPRPTSTVTLGPALGVAVLPSLALALGEGDAVRLVLLVVAAIVLLTLGIARDLRTPVLFGGGTLVVLAITRGGPYLAYVPAWLLLIAAGATVLVLAITWERSVAAGRDLTAWLRTLG